MLKKTFAAVVVAGALLFTGASAANADYTPDEDITVSDTTPAPGQPFVITVINIPQPIATVTFTVTGPVGTSLASVATATTASIDKPVTADRTSSVTVTSPNAGTVTVAAVGDDGTDLGTTTVTVAAAGAGDDDELPSTGGTVPTAALWVGAGALGLGGLAVVAATARRRAAQR